MNGFKYGLEVNCPQCVGCKDEVAGCRRNCFSYNVAVARAKDEREKIKQARRAQNILSGYIKTRETRRIRKEMQKR